MRTESSRQKAQKEEDNTAKENLQEIIKTAEVFERLEANPDWKTVKGYLKGLVDIHQVQINGWMSQMGGTSFFKRIKILDVIMVHQVRMEQAKEALSYPERMIQEAITARELLVQLRKKEKENARDN